ncbi:MAG: PD40 domain-containing protein [Deltaproteobacteria bacterium]|nr:PD40 domain-containing protein [Deltaproteobacteria bacterium]
MRRAGIAFLAAVACQEETGRDRFEDVVPVLERSCVSTTCHGVGPGERESGAYLPDVGLFFDVDTRGAVRDIDAAHEQALRFVNTVERPQFSTLLRKPLDRAWGGLPHEGGSPFRSADDPSYRALLGWIELEREGGEGRSQDELPETERFFATDVMPFVRDGGCLLEGCHGPSSAAFTALRGVADPGTGELATADIEANYETLRKFLFLSGDPLQGRLVRKPLPPEQGGIAHRGGNDAFFTDRTEDDRRLGPEVQAIVEWTRREQGDLAADRASALGEVSGIVFVRGPAAPAAIGDLDGFFPGSDLFLLSPARPDGSVAVLTEGAHPDGPADVRDPAVSHDARRVAFAMRTSRADCFHIYDLELATRVVRQRTRGTCDLPGGGRVADRWPVWGPDGRLYFSSTRAGTLREHGAGLDSDLWSVGADPDDLERVTFTPSPELQPTFFASGKNRGVLAFTAIRALGDRFEGVVFRFPLCHNPDFHGDPEYHIGHGATAGAQMAEYHTRQMPDGREAVALLERRAAFEAGDLAVVERSFGPDLPEGREAEASVPGFRHALARVNRPGGLTDVIRAGLYRDPQPMPDGSVLVSHFDGDADPTDASDAIGADFAIERVVLTEDRGDGPTLTSSEVLADAPGLWDVQPVPVVARAIEHEDHPLAWEPGAPRGIINYRHLRSLQAVFANPRPAGGLEFPEGIAFVRLVEHLPVAPDSWRSVDPSEVADGDPAPTWISNGAHDRTRILAEVPTAADSSFFLDLPSDVPFRIQALDAERMAIGAQQNRWIFVSGGETFPGGISPELFPQACAPCHGSPSGAPEDAIVVPDVVTQASMTLATHQDLNPRRKLEPVVIGDPIEVDFRRDVQPILDRSCALAGCHSGEDPAAGLELTGDATTWYSRSYEALTSLGEGSGAGHAWVDERGSSARQSALVERILGRELDAPAPVTGSCPPPGSGVDELGEDDVTTIVRWIELGAVFRGLPEAP